MKKIFNTLYKIDSKGKLQQWDIVVVDNNITTSYGKVDGKIQVNVESINSGKNIGKVNETTPDQQALNEAKARWIKQIERKGYTEDKDQALSGVVEIPNPMLAHKFSDHGEKVKYPCLVSPKLDGVRCLAVLKHGKCTLYSRGKKEFTSVPHISREIETLFKGKDIVLDGELYLHSYRDRFEDIISLVRTKEPQENHTIVEYHVFDVPSLELPFDERYSLFKEIKSDIVKPVTHLMVEDENGIYEVFDNFRSMGYEGAMVRSDIKALYKGKRTTDLLKVKEFVDQEFPIVGVKEGRGKMVGLAIFKCAIEDKTFEVKMKGSLESLAEYIKNEDSWKNKNLTVRYQNLTKLGIPRFPVGISVRNYE